jgi:hypothetical protein
LLRLKGRGGDGVGAVAVSGARSPARQIIDSPLAPPLSLDCYDCSLHCCRSPPFADGFHFLCCHNISSAHWPSQPRRVPGPGRKAAQVAVARGDQCRGDPHPLRQDCEAGAAQAARAGSHEQGVQLRHLLPHGQDTRRVLPARVEDGAAPLVRRRDLPHRRQVGGAATGRPVRRVRVRRRRRAKQATARSLSLSLARSLARGEMWLCLQVPVASTPFGLDVMFIFVCASDH